MIDNQMTLEDLDNDYKKFVDKFKPKKTTDDCYTPEPVFAAVLNWAVNEYGINPEHILRPFWPGADYTRQEYPEGWCVVDNPPFSIITEICKTFQAAGVPFFLFAPYLTNLSANVPGVCHIITDITITYENGAQVNTSFLTNLDPALMRTAPDLVKALEAADRREVKELPSYMYPGNVVTATRLGGCARRGQDVRIYPEECFYIRGLDAQRAKGKTIFGSGYLVSNQAAARIAKAETAPLIEKENTAPVHVWELSEREQTWVRQLTEREEK